MAKVNRGWVLVLALLTIPFSARGDETEPVGVNLYQAITGDDYQDYRDHWNRLFRRQEYVYGTEPADFLKKHIGLLNPGKALDIAMGEGRNAVFLAQRGFQVEGVDISDVALNKAKRLARKNHVEITTIISGLANYKIKPNEYDVIVNVDFLMRGIVPQIKKGLKKGGLVVFENATLAQIKHSASQNVRHDYLLKPGELKELFSDLQILVYEETNDGKKAKACLIARKL